MRAPPMTREDLDDLALKDAKERDSGTRGTLAFLFSMPFILSLTAAAMIAVIAIHSFK